MNEWDREATTEPSQNLAEPERAEPELGQCSSLCWPGQSERWQAPRHKASWAGRSIGMYPMHGRPGSARQLSLVFALTPPSAGLHTESQDWNGPPYYTDWELTGKGNRIRAYWWASELFWYNICCKQLLEWVLRNIAMEFKVFCITWLMSSHRSILERLLWK